MAVKHNALVWLGLALGVMSSMITGIDLAFNVYAIPLKETFNFTQTQVEILASLDTVGQGLGFLEIFMNTVLGYKIVFVSSWITMVVSSGFLSLTASYGHVFHYMPVVVYIAQLVMATGNQLVFMAVTRAAVLLVHKDNIGKFLGVFFASLSFGKIMFNSLSDLFFSENLCGFFLTVCAMSAVIFGLCFVTLHFILVQDDSYLAIPASDVTEKSADDKTAPADHISTKEMLSSVSFHLTFWPSAIYYACPFSLMNNITTIADSLRLDRPSNTIYSLTAALIVTRIVFGALFDKFRSFFTGFVIIFFANSSLGIALLLGMFKLGTATIYVMSVLIGIAMGPVFTVTASMLLMKYGRHHYTFVVGIFYVIFTILVTLIQVIIGDTYDSQVAKDGQRQSVCHGSDCFFRSFCIVGSIIITVGCAVLINCLLVIFVKDQKSKNSTEK